MSESLPNVEVSIFSSLLTPSLPQLRTAAPEPMHDYWSLALEYNTLPWCQAHNRPNCCVSQLHIFLKSPHRSPISFCADQRADDADLPCCGERQQVGVSTLTKCLQSTESIWAGPCLQTRHSTSSLHQGCGLCGEMDTSGVRGGNRF